MKRMIQKTWMACIALMCVCFVSCNDDAIVETSQPNETGQPFRLTATQGTPSRLELGQDGMTVTWEPGDQLVLVKKDRTIVPIYMNAELTAPSTSATFVSETGVPAGEYWVIYNYNDDNLAYSHQSFSTIEKINSNDKLVLWGELTIKEGDTIATIALQHLYAKVRVELQNLPEEYPHYQIGMYASKSGFPIYKQFTQGGIINADEGPYLDNSNYRLYGFHESDRRYHNMFFGTYHIYPSEFIGEEAADKAEVEKNSVLLLPADVSDGIVYFYILHGDECYEIPKSNIKFDAGKNYKVILDMANAKKTVLNSTDVTLPGNSYSNTFYQLTSPEDCRHAAYRGNQYNHYMLMNEIDFADNTYLPMMASYIDGNGYAMKNISIEWPNEDYVGMIVYDYSKQGYGGESDFCNYFSSKISPFHSECTISNLTIENATISGDDFVGTFGGTYIEVDKCKLKNSYIKGAGNYVGGFVGYNDYYNGELRISNLGISNSSIDKYCKIEGDNYVGGFLGGYKTVQNYNSGTYYYSLRLIKSCSSAASVEATGDYVGGIFGKIGSDYNGGIDFSSDDYNFSLYECINTGDVTGKNYVGGIGGSFCLHSFSSIRNKVVITKSANEGTITGISNIGGIVGENYASINLCYSIGDLTASGTNVGGIVGFKGYSTVYLSNCYSMANISVSQNSYSGGILGYAPYSASPELFVENSYFAGTNTTNCGIIGCSEGNVNVTNCLTTLSDFGDLSNKQLSIGITTTNQITNSFTDITSILQNKSVINNDNAYSDVIWQNYPYDCVKFAAGLSGSVVAPGFGTEIIY